MHVVILADSLATQRAGIYYFGACLVDELIEQYPNHRFTLITPWHLDEFEVPQEIVPIGSFPGHQRLRQFWAIPRAVHRLRPDAVLELAHFGPFFLKKKIKRITVIHDLTPLTHPQFHGRASVLAHRLLLPKVVRKADRLLVNSKATEASIKHRWPHLKSSISVFYALSEKESPTPKSTLPPPYHPYFLTVGSLEPRKNLATLLQGFEEFSIQAESHVQLHIVGGDEWKNDEFKTRLAASPVKDRVILHGHVPRQDLDLLYNNCIAYVSCSFIEGFGLPVVEAMRRGTPLLLSKIDSYLETAGPACWSFSPNDHSKLAAKMIRLFNSEQDRMLLKEQSKRQFSKVLSEKRQMNGPLDAL